MKRTKHCKGCGLILTTDINNICYTKDLEYDYCERCFNLMHYKTNAKANLAMRIANQNVNELKINQNDFVFLVNDILNVNFDLIKKYQNHQYLAFIFNKIDLVLNRNNYEIIVNNLYKLLTNYGFKDPLIFLTSINNNYGIKNLNQFVIHLPLKQKQYFVGDTNAGKTSLINKLMALHYKHHQSLIISPYLNTSLNYTKYKINKHTVIDCPGANYLANVLNYLSLEQKVNKLMNLKKAIKCHYLVKTNQSFIFDHFANLTIIPNDQCEVSFNLSLKIDIKRSKPDKLITNLNNLKSEFVFANEQYQEFKYELNDLNKTTTFQIMGLGQISIKNAKVVIINTYPTISIEHFKGRIC